MPSVVAHVKAECHADQDSAHRSDLADVGGAYIVSDLELQAGDPPSPQL